MDENNNIQNIDEENYIKRQQDLIKLMRVLDECMESMDNLYYFIKTREMLELSKDN